MSTYERYVTEVQPQTWDIPAAGAARFTWEYDAGRESLLDLYQRGKDKQWDAQYRIDWDLPVDPNNVLAVPEEAIPIYGSRQWEKLSARQREELGRHIGAWLFSQFIHGEQGALNVAARIVESVPDTDSKFYAATQVMDEARHLEVFTRFSRDKIGLVYPINPDQAKLFSDALSDARWDVAYLGMQVLAEGFALATFAIHRDTTGNPLVKQILAYVMQDEARHVAFGRLALRDYYSGLTEAEKKDREDFVINGCNLMRGRFRGQEVWEQMDLDVAECLEFTGNSLLHQAFQTYVFSRIVPCVKDIGLWSDRMQAAFTSLGVIDAARTDLDAVIDADERVADELDGASRDEREMSTRRAEVDAAIDAARAD